MTSAPIDRSAVKEFSKRFVHRRDVYALQLPDGTYTCVKRPIKGRNVLAHLQGHCTLALYSTATDGTCKWGGIDDDGEGLNRLQDMALDAQRLGLSVVLERSRRGGHLLALSKEPIPAGVMRRALTTLLQRGGHNCEVFPKQDLPALYGNALRAPLGMHRLTGQFYPLLDPTDLRPLRGTTTEILRDLPWNGERDLRRVAGLCQDESHAPRFRSRTVSSPRDGPIQRLLEKLRIEEVASRYTKLQLRGGKLVGLCPVHSEDRPSFCVFRDGHFKCYGCDVYGDALNLICLMEGWDNREAIRRLL